MWLVRWYIITTAYYRKYELIALPIIKPIGMPTANPPINTLSLIKL